jgi:hypothetical protein
MLFIKSAEEPVVREEGFAEGVTTSADAAEIFFYIFSQSS